MKVAILEDDKMVLTLIKSILKTANHQVVFAEGTFEAARLKADLLDVDIYLIDIDLKTEKSGIDFARDVIHSWPHIYLTSKTEKELIDEAAKTNPISYLLKPFQNQQLVSLLDFAEKKVESSFKKIKVNTQGEEHFILQREISYIKSDANYLEYYLKNGKRLIERNTLNQTNNQLSNRFFCRVHNRYIVNKEVVEKFDKYNITLTDNTKIPIARSRLNEVRLFFEGA